MILLTEFLFYFFLHLFACCFCLWLFCLSPVVLNASCVCLCVFFFVLQGKSSGPLGGDVDESSGGTAAGGTEEAFGVGAEGVPVDGRLHVSEVRVATYRGFRVYIICAPLFTIFFCGFFFVCLSLFF